VPKWVKKMERKELGKKLILATQPCLKDKWGKLKINCNAENKT
jgi:hypothetical protein